MVRLQSEQDALGVHSAARPRLRPRNNLSFPWLSCLFPCWLFLTAVARRWLVVFAAFHRRQAYNTEPLRVFFVVSLLRCFFGRDLATAAAAGDYGGGYYFSGVGWMALSDYRAAARRAGGGFVNHDLFWNVLSPWGGHPPGQESDTIQVGPREQESENREKVFYGPWLLLFCGAGNVVVEFLLLLHLLLLVVQERVRKPGIWRHKSGKMWLASLRGSWR